jgi:hypothetical protein
MVLELVKRKLFSARKAEREANSKQVYLQVHGK